MRFVAYLLCLIVSFQAMGLALNYDKSTNQPPVSTSSIEIKLRDRYITKHFTLRVQSIFEGERSPSRSENAYLVFRLLSHRWRLLEETDRQTSLLIDGEKLSLSSKPNYTSVVGEKYLEETLTYEVKVSDIERIAQASAIEIQIGEVAGDLKKRQLDAIRKYLNALRKN